MNIFDELRLSLESIRMKNLTDAKEDIKMIFHKRTNLNEDKESWCYETVTEGMNKYDESKGDAQKWVNIHHITVQTKEDKEQLLKAFEYIHNLKTIDTDFMAVNCLCHMYEHPEKILVCDDFSDNKIDGN